MNNLERKKYWIWLSLIKGIGVKSKQKLLEKYKDPERIYNARRNELLAISGIGEKIVNNILDVNTRKEINNHIAYMQENDIDIISINDNMYPQDLRNIYDAPISLYIKGNKEILNDISIGIVGCRDASEYGKEASKYFSYNLARNNVNVVSGLAKGIDSYAHKGALCVRNTADNLCAGRTIAVVGNGLDIVYPKENFRLAEMIVENGGTIISEYPLGTKPHKMNFPARNRIISGISKGVLVIEAKERSGTLITVDFALEQGRDVFIVPGNINSSNSIGTNNLIKQGAKVVTKYDDVLEELNK